MALTKVKRSSLDNSLMIAHNCYFRSFDATTCRLQAKDGNLFYFPNAGLYNLPQTLDLPTATGTASAVNYAYAYIANNIINLEWSLSTPMQHTSSGVLISNADSNKVLVGAAYLGSDKSMAHDGFVISQFNRRERRMSTNVENNGLSYTYPTYGDIHQINVLTFENTYVDMTLTGSGYLNTSNAIYILLQLRDTLNYATVYNERLYYGTYVNTWGNLGGSISGRAGTNENTCKLMNGVFRSTSHGGTMYSNTQLTMKWLG